MKAALVLGVLLALARPARADDHAERDPSTLRLAILATATAVYIVTDYIVEGHIAPDQCRWCVPPGFDADVRRRVVWDERERAALGSDLAAFVVTPAVAAGLLGLSAREAKNPGRRFFHDIIPVIEAGLYTHMFTQTAKYAVGRQRPYVHFDGTPEPSSEDNLSFFSGHTAFVVSVGVASSMIARRRGYRAETALWISTIGLGATTAYLRMAGDRHYLSDVTLGAMVGVAGGLLVPAISKRLADGATVAPTANGIALAGSF